MSYKTRLLHFVTWNHGGTGMYRVTALANARLRAESTAYGRFTGESFEFAMDAVKEISLISTDAINESKVSRRPRFSYGDLVRVDPSGKAGVVLSVLDLTHGETRYRVQFPDKSDRHFFSSDLTSLERDSR